MLLSGVRTPRNHGLAPVCWGLFAAQQRCAPRHPTPDQHVLLAQNGTVKLTHSFLLEHQEDRYFAPEQFLPHPTNAFKVAVFSLGLMLLQLMTLTPMDVCYLKGGFNSSLANELVAATPYSPKLTNRVRVMLSSSNLRPDFITLLDQSPSLQQKLFLGSPKSRGGRYSLRIDVSKRFICRTMVKESNHSLSPFTFRNLILTPTRVQAGVPPQKIIIQPSLMQQHVVQPVATSEGVILNERASTQKAIQKSPPRSPIKEAGDGGGKEWSAQTPGQEQTKNDLDSRILKAIQLTNETLRKNSLVK